MCHAAGAGPKVLRACAALGGVAPGRILGVGWCGRARTPRYGGGRVAARAVMTKCCVMGSQAMEAGSCTIDG
jgi:hypothetical protein